MTDRKRLRDKSFLAPLWKDLGIVGLLLAGGAAIVRQGVQINYLEKDITGLRSLAEQAKEAVVLKKWAECRDKEHDDPDHIYVFRWQSLECNSYPKQNPPDNQKP